MRRRKHESRNIISALYLVAPLGRGWLRNTKGGWKEQRSCMKLSMKQTLWLACIDKLWNHECSSLWFILWGRFGRFYNSFLEKHHQCTVPRCSSLKKLGKELDRWMEGTEEVDAASPRNRNSDGRLWTNPRGTSVPHLGWYFEGDEGDLKISQETLVHCTSLLLIEEVG